MLPRFKAVCFFQFDQHFFCEIGRMIFAQEFHGGNGCFDFMHPLFDVFFVLGTLPPDGAGLLLH